MNKFSLFKIIKIKNVIECILLCLVIILGSISEVAAETNIWHSTQNKITLEIKDKPISYILKEIQKKYGIGFVIDENLDNELPKLSINVNNETLDNTLKILFKNTKFTYFIKNNSIIVEAKVVKQIGQKKEVKISGLVVNKNGKPVTGVTILIKGTTKGAISDNRGQFVLSANIGSEIEVTHIMFKTMTRIIDKSYDDLVLKMTPQSLEVKDVVVTGYGSINRTSFTGNHVTIRRDELLKASKTNVIKAIQTFDPSFRIKENNQWGSDPNALPEVYIRGESGIGIKELDSDPLAKSNLKDNPNLPTFIMDGFEIEVSTLYDFDPNRIESITILKDAAATALYGSRAANGVVVITTVTPKEGRLNVSYSFVGDVTIPDLTDYNLLNAREKLEVEQAAGFYKADPNDIYADQYRLTKEYYDKLANISEGVDTYWLSKPLQAVFNHRHSLYLDGGSDHLRFGIEMQFAETDGVMKGSFRDRMGAGFYLQYNINSFTIRNHVTYYQTRSEDSPYGNFATYTQQLPYDKYTETNGDLLVNLRNWGSDTSFDKMNPLYEPSLGNFSKTQKDVITNNLSLNWNITPSLMLKGALGIIKDFEKSDRFYDPLSKQSANKFHLSNSNMSSGTYYKDNTDGFSFDLTTTLSYNKAINDHMINALIGINSQEVVDHYSGYTYIGFPSGDLSSPMYAQDVDRKGEYSEAKKRLFGSLASLNYSYKNIYLLDASARLDGSSVFGADNRYAPFWSMGLGLNIHNYEVFSNINCINQLRVRGSYGQTGKANFPAYASRTSYQVLTDDWYKTGYATILQALGNNDLTWETTNTFDIGAEISMFQSRLYLKASYYSRITDNLINNLTVPSSTGFTTYVENIGEISNKGIEIDLRVNVIRKRDLNLILNANLAHNKNRIEKISESLRAYNERIEDLHSKRHDWDDPDKALQTLPYIQFQTGGSMSSIWAVKSLGINPADGEEVFLDKQENQKREWSASDQVVVGSTEPKIQGSFGFNLIYKQFSLYASFMYEFGGQRYNQTLVDKVENVNIYNNNVDKRVLTDRWQEPGDISKFRSIVGDKTKTNHTKPTSRFVQDYNILSATSIELSYDLPESILSKVKLNTLTFSVASNGLFHLSTVEMERGLSYPFANSVNFSLRTTF